jgi:hypothetical protein
MRSTAQHLEPCSLARQGGKCSGAASMRRASCCVHGLLVSLRPQALRQFSDGVATTQVRQRHNHATAQGDDSVHDGARRRNSGRSATVLRHGSRATG